MARGRPKQKKAKQGGNKKGSKHYSAEYKGYIVGLYNGGMTYSLIEQEEGIPRSTACRFVKRLKEDNTTGRKSGSGRPRKTSSSQDHNIVLAVRRNRSVTSNELSKDLGLPNVSDRLIRRRIGELSDLKSRYKINKPFISPKNRRIRVKWCMDRLHYTKEQWRRFIFSDESPFVLRFNKKTRVWRSSEEKYLPLATTGTVKHDTKLMVWGCFSAAGVGSLYRIDGILDQFQYHRIIEEQLIPSAMKLFNNQDWTFQQDNDPKHTANSTKRLLNRLRVPIEDWPSQSPDLNPIENLWSQLNWQMRNRKCSNLNQLFEALQSGWNKLPVNYLIKLADSMPSRLNAVIDSKGYPTKY